MLVLCALASSASGYTTAPLVQFVRQPVVGPLPLSAAHPRQFAPPAAGPEKSVLTRWNPVASIPRTAIAVRNMLGLAPGGTNAPKLVCGIPPIPKLPSGIKWKGEAAAPAATGCCCPKWTVYGGVPVWRKPCFFQIKRSSLNFPSSSPKIIKFL